MVINYQSVKQTNFYEVISRFSFWKNIYILWEKLIAQAELPQFDRWLAHELKRHKSFGKSDRYWYSEILFAGFRFGYLAAFLEYLQSRMMKNNKKKLPDLAAAMTEIAPMIQDFFTRYPDYPSIKQAWITMKNESFFKWILLRYAGENFRSISQNAKPSQFSESSWQIFHIAQKLLSASKILDQKMIWAAIPLWFKGYLEERVRQSQWDGNHLDRFLANQAQRSPLWLRLNDPKKEQEVLQELELKGFSIERQGSAIRVEGTKGIYELAGYKNGYLEVQDLASQLIGARVNARPGEMVWDCCAGGGGKTLQIASRPGGEKGAVYASDIREYILEVLRKRAQKAHLYNVRTLQWGGEAVPEFGREIQKRGGFHWVLVDAPCSASGTWRRNPEARFRFDPHGLDQLLKLQLQLLKNASQAVIPAGHLVYATCSWLVTENEGVVEQFLRDNYSFQLKSQELLGNPYQDADTMFVAVMVRE